MSDFSASELHRYAAKFQANKRSAAARGIPFELSFEQWLTLWSEKIEDRGSRKGQFNLCRKNDLGGYVVGNCYVARKEHNSSVRGYMETRTNSIADGNHIDEHRARLTRWNHSMDDFATPLAASIHRSENLLDEGAHKDAIKGLTEQFLLRYRRSSLEEAAAIVKRFLYERLRTACIKCDGVGGDCPVCAGSGVRRFSDLERARAMKIPIKRVQLLNHKFTWLATLVSTEHKRTKAA